MQKTLVNPLDFIHVSPWGSRNVGLRMRVSLPAVQQSSGSVWLNYAPLVALIVVNALILVRSETIMGRDGLLTSRGPGA
jgi:hypothetical protein